jgi:hypothetical protein
MSSEPAAQPDEFEALYVQSARGLISDGVAFTLRGIAPSALMFSDRPERIVGHLTSAQFVDGWGDGENSFLADPPNAVLSFLAAEDETPEDVVVTLTNPRLTGEDLTYNVDVLEGQPAQPDRSLLIVHRPDRPAAEPSVGDGRAPATTAAGQTPVMLSA